MYNMISLHNTGLIPQKGETERLKIEYSKKAAKYIGGLDRPTKQVIDLMEILPESEQNFALEFVKKLVLAWDPDFTKVTPLERAELEQAMKEIENGDTIPHEAINWD